MIRNNFTNDEIYKEIIRLYGRHALIEPKFDYNTKLIINPNKLKVEDIALTGLTLWLIRLVLKRKK